MESIQTRIVFLILLLVSGCSNIDELTFTEYEFEIKGHEWEPNPYKFKSLIQDTVLLNQGNQYASWDYSYIGDIENMLKTWDLKAKPKDTLTKGEISAFKNFNRTNAKPIIIEKAKQTRVTIINEAHHMPQHRVFTTELLQELYDEGYRHLGMESYFASNKTDSLLAINKYPILTSGFYVKEPQYGNIIRQAVKIGFKIFGYESQGHKTSKEREINQAKNIEKYILTNPEGKYLIHCGFAHGIEGQIGGSWEKTMAGRLTEFTGINPLTINQTTYSEKSNILYENQYYQLTDVNEPSIYIDKDSIFGQNKQSSWFDISIFHPRTKNFDRPQWLLGDKRGIYNLNFDSEDIVCPCMTYAYLKNEEIGKAVPYDVQETNKKNVNLILEKGTYNIILINEKGKTLKTTIEN